LRVQQQLKVLFFFLNFSKINFQVACFMYLEISCTQLKLNQFMPVENVHSNIQHACTYQSKLKSKFLCKHSLISTMLHQSSVLISSFCYLSFFESCKHLMLLSEWVHSHYSVITQIYIKIYAKWSWYEWIVFDELILKIRVNFWGLLRSSAYSEKIKIWI
jgi:hypothetical protein